MVLTEPNNDGYWYRYNNVDNDNDGYGDDNDDNNNDNDGYDGYDGYNDEDDNDDNGYDDDGQACGFCGNVVMWLCGYAKSEWNLYDDFFCNKSDQKKEKHNKK